MLCQSHVIYKNICLYISKFKQNNYDTEYIEDFYEIGAENYGEEAFQIYNSVISDLQLPSTSLNILWSSNFIKI